MKLSDGFSAFVHASINFSCTVSHGAIWRISWNAMNTSFLQSGTSRKRLKSYAVKKSMRFRSKVNFQDIAKEVGKMLSEHVPWALLLLSFAHGNLGTKRKPLFGLTWHSGCTCLKYPSETTLVGLLGIHLQQKWGNQIYAQQCQMLSNCNCV